MATARDLITEAYQISGIIANAETPSAQEVTQGLNALNGIIDIENLSSLWGYTKSQATFTTDGSSTYEIGPGATIDAVRPLKIDSLKVKRGNTLYPVRQYSMDSWNMRVENTSQSGLPYRFQYIPDFPNGVIDFGNPPTTGYECVVDYEYQITQFGLNDTIDLPPGYYSTMQYLLADNLCVIFGKPNPGVTAIKNRRLLMLERNNVQNAELVSPMGGRGWYDYKADRSR